METPFEFQNYKAYLRATADAQETRGFLAKLAEAAGCQRPYLSKVLNEHVHLLPEQLYGICDYLNLNSYEKEYLMLLLEMERSGKPAYTRHLEKKIQDLKSRYEHEQKARGKLEITEVDPNLLFKYYSHWSYPLTHIATSLPNCQTMEALTAYTGIDEDQLKTVLQLLIDLRFVSQSQGRYSWSNGNFHIQSDHGWTKALQTQMRLYSLEQLDRAEGVHFSSVQSLSKKDAQKLRTRILEMIEEFNKISAPSAAEEVVVFNVDYF